MRSGGWSDCETETLKKLLKDGLSFAAISRRLPGKSRNACISKAHRLGLSGHSDRPSKPRKQRVNRAFNGHRNFPEKKPQPLPKPATPEPALLAPPKPHKPKLALAVDPFVEPAQTEDEPEIVGLTLLELEAHSCRWPKGDPQKPGFLFCGREKVTGLPYCEFHARKAFKPPEPRKRVRQRQSTPQTEPV